MCVAPKVFNFVFNTVKPFLHPVTLDKISVFGFDKNEWSAALLKEIDADQLPVHFGGTMTDSNGDPKCSSLVINFITFHYCCKSLDADWIVESTDKFRR